MDKRTALLIEDDVLAHWVIGEALCTAGYDVVSACRGNEAAEILGRNNEFDLLICDVELSDETTAAELGHVWHRAVPGRPAIFTGQSGRPIGRPLLAHETFLTKPFTTLTLLRVIATAWEDTIFYPASRASKLLCAIN